ncbi:hypothetical protein LguiB_018289 [Lonicera macranthoides]
MVSYSSSPLAPFICDWHFGVSARLGAAAISPDDPMPCVDDLTNQILEVLNYFRLGAVMCMGVMAGAFILTLFAVMSNLLYFYGMCGLLMECLLYRYFSKEVRGNPEVPESDIVQACRRLLDERQSINVLHFLQAIDRIPNISEGLKRLNCRTLIFVGEDSPFHSEALHMTAKLDRRYSALVEVCGSMVTEEQPEAMLIPMEYFLMGYGLHRPCQISSDSPRSPLSPTCIELKPIKTRIPRPHNADR